MLGSISIDIKQKAPETKEVKDLSVGAVIKFHGGAVGLVCYGGVVIITDRTGAAAFDVINKSELSEYADYLGTLAGITVQED